MSRDRDELVEVARINPVPLGSLAGERATEQATRLRAWVLAQPFRHERRSRRIRRAALVLTAVTVVAAGTAVGARFLTEQDVERFLPQGATVFAGTEPRCTRLTDGTEYRCALARAPERVTVTGADGRPAYRGAKFATADDEGRINGGCLALDDTGRLWSCYLGERAVAEGILDEGVLGLRLSGPAAG